MHTTSGSNEDGVDLRKERSRISAGTSKKHTIDWAVCTSIKTALVTMPRSSAGGECLKLWFWSWKKLPLYSVKDKNGKTRHPFECEPDALGNPGVPTRVKLMIALRSFCYNLPADFLDECWNVSETVANNLLKHFGHAIIDLFAKDYLREPTQEEVSQVLQQSEKDYWPGCFGSRGLNRRS